MNPQNLPAVPTAEEIAKKENAWRVMGNNVAITKLELSEMKDKALVKIKDVPSDTKKIVEYEAVLKEVKADKNAVIEKRKIITAKFDKVTALLMTFEKEFDPAIQVYETGLLAVKKTKADADKVVQAKADEVKRVREQIANSITSQYADFKSKIVSTVAKYYEQCLNRDITEANLPATMMNMKSYLTKTNFTLAVPTCTVTYMQPSEVVATWNELILVNPTTPESFVTEYHEALVKWFEFYAIALKNKEDSIKLAKETAATALTNIDDKKADDEIAAKLSAIATTAVVEDGGRKLKQVYELNMEENELNAIQIIAAFSANWHKAKEHLRVKKWFNLSVSQMGDTLVAMKNKGEIISITGIEFKLIDKL